MITLTDLQIRRELAKYCRNNSIPVTNENGFVHLPSLRVTIVTLPGGLNYVRVKFYRDSFKNLPTLHLEYLNPKLLLAKIQFYAMCLKVIHKEVLCA